MSFSGYVAPVTIFCLMLTAACFLAVGSVLHLELALASGWLVVMRSAHVFILLSVVSVPYPVYVAWCGECLNLVNFLLVSHVFQLHQNEYDTGQALQSLVKVINPKSIDKRWSDDDAVRYLSYTYTLQHRYNAHR